MARIALLMDPHIGNVTHDYDGSRERIAMQMAEEVRGIVSAQRPNALVIGGDLFQNRKPQPWAYSAAIRLLESNTRIIILPGNHDAANPGQQGPLDVLKAAVQGFGDDGYNADNTDFVFEPDFVRIGKDTALIVLPWTSRANLAARLAGGGTAEEQHAMMADLMRGVVYDVVEAARSVTGIEHVIAVTHFTIAGASYNSDVQPQLGESGELLLPANVFAGCDYVVSGHIHKTQTLGTKPTVWYPGSAARHDFGEEASKPSLWILDTKADSKQQFPLPAQEFVTVPVAFDSGLFGEAYEAEWPAADYNGAVLRFKGSLPAGPHTADALADFTEQAYKRGVLKVAKHAVEFERVEHREVSTTTTSTLPADALVEYIDAVGGDFELRRDDLLALHARLAEEPTDD